LTFLTAKRPYTVKINDRILVRLVDPQVNTMETVNVHWVRATTDSIHTLRGLYLWSHNGEIFLIGKADRQTPYQRWKCESKASVIEWAREQNIRMVTTLLGEVEAPRLTAALLGDVENLLIMGVQPRGNVSAKESFTPHRDRLRVTCSGLWPYPVKTFDMI
jgi:hypothetical protein